MADIPNYTLWVNEPRLPESVIDIGLRTEPNLELLTQMKPSYGLVGRVWSLRREAGADCAGTGFCLQRREKPLTNARKSLSEMAQLLNLESAARAHLDHFDSVIDSYKPRFAGRGDRPLLMVTLLDARHMLVFGNNCLFQKCWIATGLKTHGKGDDLLGQYRRWH